MKEDITTKDRIKLSATDKIRPRDPTDLDSVKIIFGKGAKRPICEALGK